MHVANVMYLMESGSLGSSGCPYWSVSLSSVRCNESTFELSPRLRLFFFPSVSILLNVVKTR